MSELAMNLRARVRAIGATLLDHTHGRRASHWLTAERLHFYSIGALACYAFFVSIYLVRVIWISHEYLYPLAMDFVPFWSASLLSLQGHAVDAYNFAVLNKVESVALGHPAGLLLWLYPPSFLLVVYPFALLPWKIAAILFLGTTYLMFVKAIHVIVERRAAVIVATAFPGALLVTLSGQNGLLTASLVAFGLALLPRRQVLAGLCFGILCVKPQLAVLIPFALLCSRSWRALGTLVATALAMLTSSVAVFGVQTLAAFLHNMGMAAGYVETGHAALNRIPSAYSLVTMMHGPTMLANAAQAVSILLATGAVAYAWSRHASHSLRAATLVCASLMVSPYLYDYDLAWLGVFIAWYAKHALRYGWQPLEREWLVVLWLMPLFGILIVGDLHFQFMPLILAATLFSVVRRIASERRAAGWAQYTGGNRGIDARPTGARG